MSLVLSRVVFVTEKILHMLVQLHNIYIDANKTNDDLHELYDMLHNMNATHITHITERFYTTLQDLSFAIKHSISRDVWDMPQVKTGADKTYIIDLSYSLFYEIVILENYLREYMQQKQEVKVLASTQTPEHTFCISSYSAFSPVNSRIKTLTL